MNTRPACSLAFVHSNGEQPPGAGVPYRRHPRREPHLSKDSMNIGRKLRDLVGLGPRMVAGEPELPEDGYTARAVAAAEAEAAGGRVDAGALAVAEACIGLWERCLASATVDPMNNRLSGLTPALLALAGRNLATTGNLVLAIRVDMGMVKLLPASHFDTFGDSNPRTWFYHATLTGPSDSRVYGIEADGVVHFRIGAGAESPWQGRAPLTRSKSTAALAAAVEASLTREARLPLGRIAPSAGTNPKNDTTYGDDLIKGGLTVAGNAVHGPAQMASGDVSASRLKPASYGPEPDQVMDQQERPLPFLLPAFMAAAGCPAAVTSTSPSRTRCCPAGPTTA